MILSLPELLSLLYSRIPIPEGVSKVILGFNVVSNRCGVFIIRVSKKTLKYQDKQTLSRVDYSGTPSYTELQTIHFNQSNTDDNDNSNGWKENTTFIDFGQYPEISSVILLPVSQDLFLYSKDNGIGYRVNLQIERKMISNPKRKKEEEIEATLQEILLTSKKEGEEAEAEAEAEAEEEKLLIVEAEQVIYLSFFLYISIFLSIYIYLCNRFLRIIVLLSSFQIPVFSYHLQLIHCFENLPRDCNSLIPLVFPINETNDTNANQNLPLFSGDYILLSDNSPNTITPPILLDVEKDQIIPISNNSNDNSNTSTSFFGEGYTSITPITTTTECDNISSKGNVHRSSVDLVCYNKDLGKGIFKRIVIGKESEAAHGKVNAGMEDIMGQQPLVADGIFQLDCIVPMESSGTIKFIFISRNLFRSISISIYIYIYISISISIAISISISIYLYLYLYLYQYI